MITSENWWNIISSYGTTIYPAQIIVSILALVLVTIWLIKPTREINILLKSYLALSFAWIGIGFFGVIGKDLAARPMSILLFSLVAIFFAIDIFRNKLDFKIPNNKLQKYFTISLLLLIFAYPFIGILLGHEFPGIIVGMFPCPTVALALILLTTALPNIRKTMYFLLLFWAIPLPIFIQIPQFGVYEDVIMLLAGIYALIMYIKNERFLKNIKDYLKCVLKK